MSETTAEDIRREMQLVRRRVRAEVSGVVDGARQLTDWRSYPQRFPWATLGVAAALAYTAVPKRQEVVRPDSDDLKKLVRDHKLLLEAKPASAPATKGAAAALLATAGSAALRLGLSYASRRFSQRLSESFNHQVDSAEAIG